MAEVQQNGQPLVKFFYNDRNQRVKKGAYANGNPTYTTFYVRDVAGQVMAVYSNAGGVFTLMEQPVYGAGRIGIAYNGANYTKTYVYELTDHLSNVRTMFTKNNNDANLEGYTDYYPGGMAMPNRNLEDASGYRYGYQGEFAEEDKETGLNAFELRMYDARINRWLTVDPMGQFDSPYLAMGNNWISNVDPNGGFTDGCCDDDWVTNSPNQLDGVTVLGTDKSGMNQAINAIGDANSLLSLSVGTSNLFMPLDSYTDALKSNKFIANYGGQNLSWNTNFYGNQSVSRSLVNQAKINTQVLGAVGKGLDIAGKGFFYTQTAVNLYNLNKAPTVENGIAFTQNTSLGVIGTFGGPAGFAMAVSVEGVKLYANSSMGQAHTRIMQNAVKKAEEGYVVTGRNGSKRRIKPMFPGSCFVKGTKVLMSDGSEKNIEDIVVGDEIMSVDIDMMIIEKDIVVQIPDYVKKYRKIVATFSNGTTNEFSPAHPYWVIDKGWCVFDLKEAETELSFSVKQLEANDTVFYYDNGILKRAIIKELRDTGEYVDMYNVEFVEKNHTFFANSILVHNKRIDD